MFSKAGMYEACGIFTTGHFILIGITLIAIIIALKLTSKRQRTSPQNNKMFNSSNMHT